jgi:hypothetical protein
VGLADGIAVGLDDGVAVGFDGGVAVGAEVKVALAVGAGEGLAFGDGVGAGAAGEPGPVPPPEQAGTARHTADNAATTNSRETTHHPCLKTRCCSYYRAPTSRTEGDTAHRSVKAVR